MLAAHGLTKDTPVDGIPPEMRGKVLAVNRDNMIEVSLGSDDGLRAGHTVEVYRGQQVLGPRRGAQHHHRPGRGQDSAELPQRRDPERRRCRYSVQSQLITLRKPRACAVVVEKPKANIYTVLLGLSLVAILIGCLCLYLEMGAYNFEFKAASKVGCKATSLIRARA